MEDSMVKKRHYDLGSKGDINILIGLHRSINLMDYASYLNGIESKGKDHFGTTVQGDLVAVSIPPFR